MDGPSYFVVRQSEDGGHSIRMVNKEQLQKLLLDEGGLKGDKCQKEFPDSRGYLGPDQDFEGFFVIKGWIVTPKPKEVVTEFEIP